VSSRAKAAKLSSLYKTCARASRLAAKSSILTNDAKYMALKEFASSYSTLTNDQATGLVRKMLGVDQSVAELRLRYTSLFNNVIPGRKTAVFFQLDRRLVMLIDLQLASQIPMILLSGGTPVGVDSSREPLRSTWRGMAKTGATLDLLKPMHSHCLRQPPLIIPTCEKLGFPAGRSLELAECMVRRMNAREKFRMKEGLRQCIRPLGGEFSPGLDEIRRLPVL